METYFKLDIVVILSKKNFKALEIRKVKWLQSCKNFVDSNFLKLLFGQKFKNTIELVVGTVNCELIIKNCVNFVEN